MIVTKTMLLQYGNKYGCMMNKIHEGLLWHGHTSLVEEKTDHLACSSIQVCFM